MIGIDPGLKGGIAWYRDEPGKNPLSLWDMPVKLWRGKKEIHGEELACIISEVPLDVPVLIEEVGAMPHDGRTSIFTFGTGYGIILGVCASQHRTVYRVRPAVWKTLLGLSRDKKASIALAKHTFPGYAFHSDGPAEAALLAKLGHDKFSNIGSDKVEEDNAKPWSD